MIPVSLADEPLFGLPLEFLWFVAIFYTLAMFLWLDGTNFGIGVLYELSEDEAMKEMMLATIAPLWDGAEVWLIVFGGALFAVFPDVYAELFSRYYLLMFAILGALIIRGISPEFREQRSDDSWRHIWDRLFVLGSVLSPLLLGVFTANWVIGSQGNVSVPGFSVGVTLVALSTVEGVAFLGMKVEGTLPSSIHKYGVVAQGTYLVLAVASITAIYFAVDELAAKLLTPFPLVLIVLTVIFGVAYLLAFQTGRYRVAFGIGAGETFGLVSLVAFLLYPDLLPGTGLTVTEAAVSTLQLNVMMIVLAIFLPLVLVYFAVLYNAFAGTIDATGGY